jgi:hypothetical protein
MTLQAGRIPADRRQQIDTGIEVVIEGATRFALDSPTLDPGDALDHLYSAGLRLRAGTAQ